MESRPNEKHFVRCEIVRGREQVAAVVHENLLIGSGGVVDPVVSFNGERRRVPHESDSVVGQVGQRTTYRRALHDPFRFGTADGGAASRRCYRSVFAARNVVNDEDAVRPGEIRNEEVAAHRHGATDFIPGIDGETRDHLLGRLLGQELGPRVVVRESDIEEDEVDVCDLLLRACLHKVTRAVAIKADPISGVHVLIRFIGDRWDGPHSLHGDVKAGPRSS